MQRSLWIAVLALTASTTVGVLDADACNLCRSRRCASCCCNQQGGTRSFSRGDETSRGVAAPVVAPVVMSAPVFSMPMMYTGMPMMGVNPVQFTQTSRGDESSRSGGSDCCEQVEKLAKEVDRISKSVENLQQIVDRQLFIMEEIQRQHLADQRRGDETLPAKEPCAAPAGEPKLAPKAKQ